MTTEKFGYLYGRPDIDRVGLFAEMSYMNGKGYTPPLEIAPTRLKSRAFPIPLPKWKTDLQDCYFDKEFKRIFEKEPYRDVFRDELKEQLKNQKKQITKTTFKSTVGTKLSSTPGDIYGTFTEKVEAFSPLTRPEKKKEQEMKGFLVPYPKQGNSGYTDITFDKYPEHLPDPYDAALDLYRKNFPKHKSLFKSGPFKALVHRMEYFDENPYKSDKIGPTYKETKEKQIPTRGRFLLPGPGNKLGGNKSGGFDKYPSHSTDKYLTEIEVNKELKNKLVRKGIHNSGPFKPVSYLRSWRIKSTVEYNMKMKVHAQNWRCAKPFVQPFYSKRTRKPLSC